MHNALGLTAPVTTEVVQLWDRPFKVAWADIPDLLLPLIQDPAVVSIAREMAGRTRRPVPRADLDTEEPAPAVASLRLKRRTPTAQRRPVSG